MKGDPGAHVVELVVAAVLALGGARSLARWMGLRFDAESAREQLLYVLHATARVGLWFAFAAYFAGYALVAETAQIRWFVMVPIALAGVQLLTAVVLARSPKPALRTRIRIGTSGKGPVMNDDRGTPGPLEPEKEGETADSGHPQPEAAEVESARLLANQSEDALRAAGLSEGQIRRLAEEYITLDRGEDLQGFIAWARGRAAS